MRTHRRSGTALLATTAFAAITVVFAGNAAAAVSSDLAGSCSARNGTVMTLDLDGYNAAGPNIAHVSLDGSRASNVSFGSAYHWSSGRLSGTVAHTARVSVSSSNARGVTAVTFTDAVSVAACK